MKTTINAFDSLMSEINYDLLPSHIAIIMDGNRRWAKERNLPSVMGHKEGEKVFHQIVKTCSSLGIKALTAYAFSVENWKRSSEEVGALMRLFEFYTKEKRKYLIQNNVRLKIIGNKKELPESLLKEFEDTEELTKNFEGLQLNLAVNYGSRQEIVFAFKKIAQRLRSLRRI